MAQGLFFMNTRDFSRKPAKDSSLKDVWEVDVWGYHEAHSYFFHKWDMLMLDVLVSAGAIHIDSL